MFDQNRISQTVSLNSQYTVVFCDLNDQIQFWTMARQTTIRLKNKIKNKYI